MALTDITSRAILEAVAEYDRLGRAAFLQKYGFGQAKEYFLVVDGREYDSKAIVGAAHGYQFPDQGPLRAQDFSGGYPTVHLLELRGFTVRAASGGAAQPSQPLRPTKASGNGTDVSAPKPVTPVIDGNRLQTLKLVLEIVAIAVTIIGGIIGIIWSIRK